MTQLIRGGPWVRRGLFACALVLIACQEEAAAPADRPVPPGAFGVAGPLDLAVALLDSVRAGGPAQPVEPGAAADGIVRDALFSLEARRRFPHLAPSVERGVLARALLRRLGEASLQRTPATQEEERSVIQELWRELDRPRSVSTGYAYLPFQELSPGEHEFAQMERAAAAFRGTVDPKKFAPTVRSVLGGQATLGQVPPLTADNRLVPVTPADREAAIPPAPYGRHASALSERGQISPVFATTDGVFLLVALEIVPPRSAPEAERSRLVAATLEARRADLALRGLAARLGQIPVTRSPKQKTLTRRVWQTE